MKASLKAWFLLILLSLVWGSSFILMKKGLRSFSSNEVAALRMSFAFLFLSPLLFRQSFSVFRTNAKGIILMSVFGNFLPAFLFTAAETRISSSLTGMLNALTPLFTVIVGFLWLRSKPSSLQLAGIVVGLIAAVALVYFDPNNTPSSNALFGLLVVAATLCYAVSINAIKKYLSDVKPVTATVFAFTLVGPVSMVYLTGFTNFAEHFQQSPDAWSSLFYTALLGIVGTAIAVILYNILIKEAGVIFSSTCTYLIPVVAIIWGLIDYELMEWMQFFSILIIILSVYLINRR